MSKDLFPSAPADVQLANVEAKPVVANVDGESTPKSDERLYRVEEVESLVKERLVRERKKIEREYETKLHEIESASKKPSANVEEDFKAKLVQFENEKRVLAERLDAYRQKTLQAELARRLAQLDCLDPELVSADLLHRKVISLDDDDNLVADSVLGDVDETLKGYLGQKPYLVRANGNGGVGSKAPKAPLASTDVSNMPREEMEARLGVKKRNRLFSN